MAINISSDAGGKVGVEMGGGGGGGGGGGEVGKWVWVSTASYRTEAEDGSSFELLNKHLQLH